jgi:hypothetical protein
MGLIGRLPWWLKIGGKITLSRLPVPYGFWRFVGLFRHGDMNRPERAIASFRSYFDRACAYRKLQPGFVSLELGPGDSVLAGLAARAFGAERAWLMDAGAFAVTDVEGCVAAARLLAQAGRPLPDLGGCTSLADVLQRCRVNYLTEGVAALRRIPTASVDFVWSQVVLEHVPMAEFDALLAELRRIARDDAIGVHGVDFRDHLSGGLQSLRFSTGRWESSLFRNSGFYTNRIRCAEMVERFRKAGFAVEVRNRIRWPALPLARRQMATPYRDLDEDDLLTAEAQLVVRPLP